MTGTKEKTTSQKEVLASEQDYSEVRRPEGQTSRRPSCFVWELGRISGIKQRRTVPAGDGKAGIIT